MLGEASDTLMAGTNYHKQTLLITDGRAHGWRMDATEDWQSLGGRLASRAASQKSAPRVQVLCLAPRQERNRTGAAEPLVNLAIEGVRLSRPVIGTDMPVMMMVDVRNTGQAVAGENVNLSVRLSPDDKEAFKKATVGKLVPLTTESIRPGQTVGLAKGSGGSGGSLTSGATVQLEVKFDRPGPYRLLFELETSDALPGDNRLVYAVEVLNSLPVLMVNGNPSPIRDKDECFWLKAAFQPLRVDRADLPIEFLISPKVIEADSLGDEDLGRYDAIVLANVPRLPTAEVDRLKEFVANGGGLLIAPGEKVATAADRDFYNTDLFEGGKGLLPATLGLPVDVKQPELFSRSGSTGRKSATTQGEESEDVLPVISLLPPVHGHPAFVRTGDVKMWEQVRVFRHFPLNPAAGAAGAAAPGAAQVATVLRLSAGQQGQPGQGGAADEAGMVYAAEKQYGRGRVIELGGPIGIQWSNMLLCRSPIAAVNELMYYLSAPRRTVLNVQRGQRLIAPSNDRLATAEVIRPDGQIDKAPTVDHQGRLQFEYPKSSAGAEQGLIEPGVYEMRIPSPPRAPAGAGDGEPADDTKAVGPSAGQPAGPADKDGPKPIGSPGNQGSPGSTGSLLYFTVQRDPGESLMTLLNTDANDTKSDATRVANWLAGRIQFHEELATLLESEKVSDPGREIWKWVAAAVLVMLLLEIWLSGWITRRRHGDGDSGVSFGQSTIHTVR